MNAPADHSPLPASSRLRIVVLGYIVRGPMGGLAWHHLQYVAGLIRLGHDVLYVEDSDDYPSCVHVRDGRVDTDPREGLEFTRQAFSRLNLLDRFAYFDAHAATWRGPWAESAEDFCRSADVVLNISAVNPVRPWWTWVPLRVLIDTDPVFVQIRHLQSAASRQLASAHNAFFTFGERFGYDDCTIPDDGFGWKPTRQPVLLECWPPSEAPSDRPFSTVMQWGSYRALEHEGVRYGMKSDSFGPYLDLPRHAPVPLLLGIGGASRPRGTQLQDHGWQVQNTSEFTEDPWQYQNFIQQSAGEFSVAKQAYVVSRSGWFSERSANYLASGRPVVVQDTGFSDILRTGEGLLAFRTPQEARDALQSVCCDLPRHSAAARRIAETHFDSDVVLSRLLSDAGALADSSPISEAQTSS